MPTKPNFASDVVVVVVVHDRHTDDNFHTFIGPKEKAEEKAWNFVQKQADSLGWWVDGDINRNYGDKCLYISDDYYIAMTTTTPTVAGVLVADEKDWICTDCKTINSWARKTCTSCGCRQQKSETIVEVSGKCDNCGADISVTVTVPDAP